MKEKRKNIFNRKAFLNKSGFHSDANIVGHISTYESDTSYSLSSDLSIKDCHAKINLSIDLYDDRSYKNTIFKLDKLISELELYRQACDQARIWHIATKERVEERIKEMKEKDKKKKTVAKDETPARRVFTGRGVPRQR